MVKGSHLNNVWHINNLLLWVLFSWLGCRFLLTFQLKSNHIPSAFWVKLFRGKSTTPPKSISQHRPQFAEMAPRGASPPPRPQKPKEAKAFNCPKCGKSFPILQILQNHVNDCLDREWFARFVPFILNLRAKYSNIWREKRFSKFKVAKSFVQLKFARSNIWILGAKSYVT